MLANPAFSKSHIDGLVNEFTLRVIIALQSLAQEQIKWPDAEERVRIAREIGNVLAFRKCVGFVNGSYINLWSRPSKHGDHYYSYKGSYCLNSLAVVDNKKKICYLNLGWVGCAHNQKVMEHSNVGCQILLCHHLCSLHRLLTP